MTQTSKATYATQQDAVDAIDAGELHAGDHFHIGEREFEMLDDVWMAEVIAKNTRMFQVGQGVRWGSEYWTVVGHNSNGETVTPNLIFTAIERFDRIRVVRTHELSNADSRF